jgi:eukaryotic-like serine/threonine-protein kinase
MTPERWQQVKAVFQSALDREPRERALFLAQACADDPHLRSEVEALISSYRQVEDEQAGGSLETVAVDVAEQMLAGQRAAPTVGQKVGHYELVKKIGAGGMGEVYLAHDSRLARKVALKLLPSHVVQDRQRLDRFKQEARAASALNHPNILTIYEIGEETGRPFIATEFIEGKTLRERIAVARLPIGEALDVAVQVATGLNAAHEAGIVHRDIKPENIMLRRDGYVKILDFGLAKLTKPHANSAEISIQVETEEGVVLGTPRYMSPEQARGERVDARTDIFSLGVMLYEIVAGRPPFAGATPSEMIAAILRDTPLPLTTYASAIPPELQQIVDRALQKNRETRYQRMQELLADLKRLQRQLERRKELPDTLPHSAQPRLEREATASLDGEAVLLTKALKSAESTTGQVAAITGKHQSFDKLKQHKLGLVVILTLLLAAVTVAGYFSFFGGRAAAIESLAVLPFVNVGANPDTEYLSDGITDSLINGLSRLPKLKVMSRNSVFRYKGKETDAQQVGNTLGVRAVLMGKVTQRGDDLLISVELVDVRDNSHLWGEQYNHKLSNLPAVQTDLARNVSQQLRLKLSSAEQQQLAKRGTENAKAYELYLKGRYQLNTLLPESEKRSLEYFRQALEKDAGFAPAYAGLAGTYVQMASVGTTFEVAPKELFQQAKVAASKAVELDSTLAEAHLALAEIARVFEWDWNGAEREYKRASELNPNFVPVHHFYAHHLVLMNRFEESLAESQRALALDPLDVGINFHLGWNYCHVRQYDQAETQLKKTLAMDPNHTGVRSVLGLVYVHQGRYQEAIAALQKSREQRGRDFRGNLALAYALAGQRDEAQKLLKQLQEEGRHKYVSPYNIAKIYLGLGEKDQAFVWLEKAIVEREGNLTDPGLHVDAVFDSLHSDPRFANLLRRMGLE